MGLAVIDVQETPNPDALKFVLNRSVSEHPVSSRAGYGGTHALLRSLMAIDCVSGVLLLGEFVIVTRTPAAQWRDVRRRVETVIRAADGSRG